MLSLTVIFLFSLISFGLSNIVGGGASIILIPVLAKYLPIAEVPSALVVGTFSSSLSRSYAYFEKINWRLVSLFVPAALPAVALGAYLLAYVDPLIISWICGLFLISNIPLFFRKNSNELNLTFSPVSKRSVIGIAVLAGLISGITGAVGLIFNGFYLKCGLSKEEIIATRAANEILLHLVKLIFYINLGLFSQASITIGILIAIAAMLSISIMRVVLPLLSANVFKKIGYGAMACSGVLLLVQTSTTILSEREPAVKLVSVDDGVEAKFRWAHKIGVLEVEYDGAMSLERVVSINEVPLTVSEKINELSKSFDNFMVEEVYAWNDHYYEVYLDKPGVKEKYEIRL